MMRLCMGCMSEIDENQDVCPYCGYRKDTPVEEAYYLLPETVLSNRYIVGKVLGYGGFGVTYIGWDGILKRIVAIKEYFPSDYATRGYGTKKLTIYSGDAYEQFQAGLSSFISEAKRQAQLHNVDGVVRIYDCVQENDTGYIIMEFLDGKTIKELLQDDQKYSYEEAEKIIVRVLETLAEVHKTGIIHRDVAPDNIFITRSGEVKLIDFGAARYAASVKSRSLSVILKPGYAPEEQYRSHGVQGPWTDVYGAGATFYRMITGVKPDEAIERMVDDQLLLPSELGVSISPEKEKVLMKSLSVRKEGRYQTAEEFLKALTNIGKEPAEEEKKESRPKSKKFPTVAGILCVAAVGIGVAGYMGSQKQDKPVSMMQTETESETVKQTETESETVKQTETESETVKQTETESETVKQTETESETVKQTETESETVKQTETESETVKQTETESETVKQTETESETEKQTEAPKTWSGTLSLKTDGEEQSLQIKVDETLQFAQLEIFTANGTEETVVYKTDLSSAYAVEVQPELDSQAFYNLRMLDEAGNQVYGYYNLSLAGYGEIEIQNDNGYLAISGKDREGKAIEEKQYEVKTDSQSSIRYSLSSLNIRRKPDTETGEKMSRYALGDEITVYGTAKGFVSGESADWYLVKCSQGYGFISANSTYTTDSKEEADAAVEEARKAAEAAAAAAAAQAAQAQSYSSGGSSSGGSSKKKSSGGGGVVWDNGGVQWD